MAIAWCDGTKQDCMVCLAIVLRHCEGRGGRSIVARAACFTLARVVRTILIPKATVTYGCSRGRQSEV